MSYLAILGRQPALSLAELISLFGTDAASVSTTVARINRDDVDLRRLGGTQKLMREITTLSQTDLTTLLGAAIEPVITRSADISKPSVGISIYGRRFDPKEIFASALALKKELKTHSVAVRIVPTKDQEINAAQIIHNQMLERGADIVLIFQGSEVTVGLTEQVQDIEAYTKRDYDRPARSAKVGMLPPKLAQMMINLANPTPGSTILDPFCGTGVVLQEAALMGYQAYGSDIEAELIAMSKTNLDYQNLSARLEVGDATTYTWKPPVGAVVTEGYLGTPQTGEPSEAELTKLKTDATTLTLAFLQNLHGQIASGTPVCMSLPAWRQKRGFERLGILDQISALGYTVQVFSPITQQDLLYVRPDQIVARELIILRSN